MGLKGYNGEVGGEIVEVQGGHIIRATGRKDRHSKVFTSKGPRDRRVRLSAHTAIQFYDVQDRLGYDRPSKAVDWLIKKAKTAIDKLEIVNQEPVINTKPGSSSTETNFVAANLDPRHEDAMKTFFPTSDGGGINMNFQNYPHHQETDNIVSRNTRATTTTSLSQDLGLSLHTFQENNNNNNNTMVVPETSNFITTSHYDTFGRISGWNDHQDLTMTSSSSTTSASQQQQQQEQENQERNTNNNGGFMMNQPSMMTLLNSQQQVFLGGQQQQQRGTLQSSLFPHSFRSWDHHHDHQHHHDHHQHHNNNQVSSSSVMFNASPSQFGTHHHHGMMMMHGLSFPIHGDEATQPHSSSSSPPPPNSHL
ncbi:unnamed protein product [Cochlearia groenlandica]